MQVVKRDGTFQDFDPNKIKVANTLPALLIPIVYYLVTLWIK